MIACKCGEPAVVQWKRRPAPDEAQQAAAQEATPADTPAAEGLPSDKSTDSYVPVYACADHALTADSAALMHESTCTGPGKARVCDCEPEAATPDFPTSPGPVPGEPERRLPPGW